MVRPPSEMFTDLHCHLLHDFDDGPRTIEGSLAMARLLVSHGFGAVAATPHAMPQFPGAEVAAERRAELAARLAREGIPLRILEGAENRFDAEFLQAELEGRGRHLAGNRWALVETPFEGRVAAFGELLFRLRRKGVFPLFAHAERCGQFQEVRDAAEAVRLGAALQLDVGSLVGVYGKPARKSALALLEAGLYAVAATDLHDADPKSVEWLAKGLGELERRAGRAGMERLLGENPGRVAGGEELP